MSDELRERLRRLDPMHQDVSTDPVTSDSARALLEDIMNTPVLDQHPTPPAPARPRRTGWWVAGAAAAAVAALGGGIALTTAGGSADDAPDEPPLELALGADDPMAMCMAIEPQLVADMPIAFAGTVSAVEGETVTIDVTEWFAGGDAEQVSLAAPAGMEALIGGVEFTPGSDYLITATDGTVNYCGFSGPDTPELRAIFDQAFPG